MHMQQHFPKTLFIAPEVSSNGKSSDVSFPKLNKVNFELGFAPIYYEGALGMAEPIKQQRCMPTVLLTRLDTGGALNIVTPDYHKVEFNELHQAVEKGFRATLPQKYLEGIEVKEFSENGGIYNEVHYDLKNLKFQVKTPNGWETEFNACLIVKSPMQNGVTMILGARCSDTDNIYMLGKSMAATLHHRKNFNTDRFVSHIKHSLPMFPAAVRKLQEFANHKINAAQAKTMFALSPDFTETVQDNLFDWYENEEAITMGHNKLTVLATVAAFAHDSENFKVKNEAVADNTVETLASRKKWMSNLVSTSAFFGKGGFHA